MKSFSLRKLAPNKQGCCTLKTFSTSFTFGNKARDYQTSGAPSMLAKKKSFITWTRGQLCKPVVKKTFHRIDFKTNNGIKRGEKNNYQLSFQSIE
jgi:hypothetical protein